MAYECWEERLKIKKMLWNFVSVEYYCTQNADYLNKGKAIHGIPFISLNILFIYFFFLLKVCNLIFSC